MKEIVGRLHENRQIELAKSILESAGYEVKTSDREEMENVINKLSDNYPKRVNRRLSQSSNPEWNSLSDFSDAELREIYLDLYLNRSTMLKGIFIPDSNGHRVDNEGNLVGYSFMKSLSPRSQNTSHEVLLRHAMDELGKIDTYYAWVASIDPFSDNPVATVDIQSFGTDTPLPELEEFAKYQLENYWKDR